MTYITCATCFYFARLLQIIMKSASLILLVSTSFIGLCISRARPNPDGFLSVNCGAFTNRTDDEGVLWIPDFHFTRSRNCSIVTNPWSKKLQYKTLAYFTNPAATKYCYLFPVKPGVHYLVRAMFSSGALETSIPLAGVFDLLINGIKWMKADLTDLQISKYRYYEIIIATKSENLSLCLARNSETGNNYVFISAVVLRPLQSPMYNLTDFHKNALLESNRMYFGNGASLSYPDDSFDRMWISNSSSSMKNITTEESLGKDMLNQPPMAALRTAITKPTMGDLQVVFPLDQLDEGSLYYFALYFCNLNQTSLSRYPKFQVFINENRIADWVQFTSFLQCRVIQKILKLGPIDSVNITLRPEKGSDMGPFINAAEAYQIEDIQNMTYYGDVSAIREMANSINVPDDWFGGDPCLPSGYASTGIVCNQDNPSRVIILNLTNSNLSGPIPPVIANLTALTQLLLGNNGLSGFIPDLSSLKNLTILELQNNQLTGSIPSSLEKLTMLNQVYLQNNTMDVKTVPQGLKKPGLILRLTPQRVFQAGNKHHKLRSWIVAMVVSFSFQLLIVVLVTFLWRCKLTPQSHSANHPVLLPQDSFEDKSHEQEYHRLAKEYTEEEIKAATNNYSTVIGNGGFGSVFHGRISGLDVAIKILSTNSNQGQHEFENEVTLLCRLYHKNLVNLIGYCKQPIQALVYEYMHRGSLKDHLYGTARQENPLDWHTRLSIALQAAEGFLYLHQGCHPPIIHRDIKCSNILLDARMTAKVSDFGLAKLLDNSRSHVLTTVKGTLGYLDPEYYGTSALTEKSDVYSFGVVLLEIISGIPPSQNIVTLAKELFKCGRITELMDSALGDSYKLETAWNVAEVAFNCVAPKSTDRPTMRMVAKDLEEAVALEFRDSAQYKHIPETAFHESDMPVAR